MGELLNQKDDAGVRASYRRSSSSRNGSNRRIIQLCASTVVNRQEGNTAADLGSNACVGQYSFRIIQPNDENMQNSSSGWRMSGLTEESSRRWTKAIHHNCVVLGHSQCGREVQRKCGNVAKSNRNTSVQVQNKVAQQNHAWDQQYTENAQAALSSVLYSMHLGVPLY